ncbi:MAG: hypothetical protein J6S85_14360 [Methanobrevibacter sp.]|nr:hypothetical protein [Methanobrevibacter sp.]
MSEQGYRIPTPEERIQEANKKISKAICLIQSAQEFDLEFAFKDTDWNDEVRDDIDKALKYLSYATATFTLWNEDLDKDA